jgi:hypothetical protein
MTSFSGDPYAVAGEKFTAGFEWEMVDASNRTGKEDLSHWVDRGMGRRSHGWYESFLFD